MSLFAGNTNRPPLLRVMTLAAILLTCVAGPGQRQLQAQPAPQEDRPRLVLNVQGPHGRTRAVGFSRDSQRIYTAGFSKVVDIWDVGWNKAANLPGPVAATPVRTLRWEVARGNRGVINVMAISPTREQIAVGGFSARGSNGDIILFDTDRAEVETSLPIDRDNQTALPGHRQAVTSLDYSPDGNRIVSVSFDGEIWVWTAPPQPGAAWTPQLIRQAQGSLFDRQPAIFLDNNTIVAAERVNVNVDTQWRLVLYNVQGQQLGALPQIHDIRVSALTRSLDGTTWFSASGRDHNNAASTSTIFIWTGPGQQQPRVLRSSNREPSSLSPGPGGLLAVSNFLAPVPDSRQQGIVELYDVAGGQMIDQVALSQQEHCLSCQISPDGSRLIAHGDDQLELFVFDLLDANGQLLPQPLTGVPPVRLRGRGRDVFHVAFAVPAQGEQVPRIGIGQSANGQIDRVLSPAEGTLLPPAETDRFIVPTAFSDDWTVEFNTADIENGTQNVTFRHPQRGASTIVLNVPRQGTYRGVHCFIPDAQGRAFAVALGTDTQNGVFVYQLPLGRPAQLLRYFRDHSGAVTSVGASADGRYLVSGAKDQTVKIWSLAGLAPYDQQVPERIGWGADFTIENGQVVARNVLKPGIAFARRLRDGDAIAQLAVADANGTARMLDQAADIHAALRSLPLFETVTLFIRHAGAPDGLDTVPVVPGWEPLLTLFADEVDEWALFTPEGYYDASIAEGAELFGWQINRGRSFTPRFERAENLQNEFEKPDVIREVLRLGSVIDALTALTLPVPDVPSDALAEKIRTVPEIKITDPVQSANFGAGDDVTVQARIVLPEGKQVADLDIRAHQSGRSLGDPDNIEVNGRNVVVQWTTQPVDALGSFSVTAQEKERSVQNSPQQIDTVKVRGTPDPKAEEEGELHIIAIASETYEAKGLKPLKYTIDDVEDVVDRFAGPGNGARWKRAPGYDQILRNEQVTEEAVRAAIEAIQKRASSPHDVLLFYMSGHGTVVDGEFYYLPVSIRDGNDPDDIRNNGIPWTTVCAALKNVQCRVVWMLDACHSGAVVGRELSKAQLRNARNPNQFVLAATGATAAAFEDASYKVEPDDEGHGLFTFYVLKGLDGEADAASRANSNNVTEFFELATYVTTKVFVESGREQRPVATPTNRPAPRTDETTIELLRVPGAK
ncbi:WD domain, G-beta repeat [Maioricimonas rarisocia]|uniref:WD domain, G-beta repeat n=1 Tax=Maioricimonas rarisocia TaxID=2528026 RepID=A0A517ZED1_9PLAN|nr:caspase family protein [Maioricimonas rarisocia]QDU40824.1 WD domain, G-beta repeat [Maioricimonas rarisocia]